MYFTFNATMSTHRCRYSRSCLGLFLFLLLLPATLPTAFTSPSHLSPPRCSNRCAHAKRISLHLAELLGLCNPSNLYTPSISSIYSSFLFACMVRNKKLVQPKFAHLIQSRWYYLSTETICRPRLDTKLGVTSREPNQKKEIEKSFFSHSFIQCTTVVSKKRMGETARRESVSTTSCTKFSHKAFALCHCKITNC